MRHELTLRELACLVLRLTGVPLAIREIVQRRLVTILVYHRLDPVTADRHFTVLARSYTPISLQAYLEARRNNAVGKLPPKPLVITIDDGHESVYRLEPVLTKHHIPITVFLCSGLVGTNRRFWFSSPALDVARREYLKRVPDHVRIGVLMASGFGDGIESGEKESLSAEQILQLQDLVDFQSHSISHPILTKCLGNKAAAEIKSSRTRLEEMLGRRVNAFAYPNGSYGRREIRLAGEAGYECALTTDSGFNAAKTPLFELKRLVVRDDCGVHELVVRSCGVWELLRRAVRRIKPRSRYES